jgi:RNA polymerase sigma-70 factor (ECF subfamily)
MQIYEKLLTDLLKHDVENFKSWLHVLTRNFCLMKIRTQKAVQLKNESLKKDVEIFMETSYEMHPDNGQALDADVEALKKCMEKLNADQKTCVALFYLEEKCYQEIADTSGFNLKKVKSFIQNGKRNLKICLEKSHVNI